MLTAGKVRFIKISDSTHYQPTGVKDISAKRISIGIVIAFAAIGLGLTYTTAGFISIQQAMPVASRQLHSGGTIASINVGIYSDHACSRLLQSIDWGTIVPGGTVERTVYVKNTGNSPLILNLTTNSWNPAAAIESLALTWNKEGATLNAGETTMATLALVVAQDISGITTFSVAIVISGSA